MDRLIARFDAEQDGDLMLCEHRGVAYQRSSGNHAKYDDAYAEKFIAYDNDISAKVIKGRLDLVKSRLPDGAKLLDFGCGDGRFLFAARDAGIDAKGFEVIPGAVEALKAGDVYANDVREFDAVCFWDVIEHLDVPEAQLKRVKRGAHVFCSLPIFDDLRRIRQSKHYRPGEHLYYWTREGFIEWMGHYDFRCIEISDHETEAGRDSIGAFAFVRDLPGYGEHIAAYQEMHATRHYGDSATEFHLKDVADVVRKYRPKAILDYGCGRSDLIAHFWLDGKRRIERYDPAIPRYCGMPEGEFNLVLACDVMEHIPLAHVQRVLNEIRAKSPAAFFTISVKPARARLPDGRNAHVTLLTKSEWTRWIRSVFGSAQVLPSEWDHVLILFAGATL